MSAAEVIPLQAGAPSTTVPSIDTIKQAVAALFEISVLDLESTRQAVAVARPRQIAMYLAKRMTMQSLPAIGRRFGRDHTTVMYACEKVEELMAADPELRRRIEGLRDSLLRHGNLAVQVGVGSLEAAALSGMLAVIRGTKSEGAGPVQGHVETVRLLLQQAFGEQPHTSARGRNGVSVEWLVSPTGSWSRIELIGETATIVDGGVGWRAI